jgi:hypothetical protein
MRRKRPSPATVLACAALIVALGGTAVAGGVLNKKKVNKIITNRAPGLSVSHAKTADSASSASSANSANSANSAKNVYFVRANYSTLAGPTIVSSSPGVIGAGETFPGYPRVIFPQDMTNCAITGTAVAGGDVVMRQSSNFSSGATVVMHMALLTGADVRANFNLVAVCP